MKLYCVPISQLRQWRHALSGVLVHFRAVRTDPGIVWHVYWFPLLCLLGEYCVTADSGFPAICEKMLFDHWTNSSWLLWIKNCYSAEIKPKEHSGSKVFCLNGTQIRAAPWGCLCSLLWSPRVSKPTAKSLHPDLRNMVSQICLFQTRTSHCFHSVASRPVSRMQFKIGNFMEYCAIFLMEGHLNYQISLIIKPCRWLTNG